MLNNIYFVDEKGSFSNYDAKLAGVKSYCNYEIDKIVTPIKVNALHQLLKESQYDQAETNFLIQGFTEGFKLGYCGPRDVKRDCVNLKFRVGDKFDLWDKIMDEVKAKRYGGPFDAPNEIYPSAYSVNPCGLVPKSGNKTRLINHYSSPPGTSVNDYIPDEYAKVVYQDFQDAVRISLDILKLSDQQDVDLHYSRTDAKNAFRVLPIAREDRFLQILKAENPLTKKYQYFVDLCCGFGSRSSCFLYSKVSSCLRHIYRWKTQADCIVYLDDGLQIGLSEGDCNQKLDSYLGICEDIGLPISDEKTERAVRIIIFLGLILNAIRKIIGIPQDKVSKALNQIERIQEAKKVTVLDMQKITGLLNFFTRAVVPGRAFTRRLYAAYSNPVLKQHHHVRVTNEMKLDLGMWKQFLNQSGTVMRPFIDFSTDPCFDKIAFASDAAKSQELGYSVYYIDEEKQVCFYCYDQWDQGLISQCDPSIQFLELFPLAVGVVLFSPLLSNSRVKIMCDNQAVVHMVNSTTSSCKHCMILIRLITLKSLEYNVVYRVEYVSSKKNHLSDSLSRLNFAAFKSNLPKGVTLRRIQTPRVLKPINKFFVRL